ncbi:MAG: hypothetical protein K0Q73_2990 [Paenibacillus sp.]|nr:hypothetical protein [Paenibacillus sp.]
MKIRMQYLDVCKGIGIILVVLGHIFLTNPIRTWIYSFHMPFFFFLSGYTLYLSKTTDYKEFVLRRLKSLIIPYFIFAFIWYIYWLVIERKFRPESLDINGFKPLLGILYGTGSDTWLVFNIVLWFLPCFFLTEIFFQWLSQSIKKSRNLFIVLLVSSVVGYLISLFLGFRLPWGINIVFTSVVFYGLGYLFHKSNLNNKLTSTHEYIFIILLLIINVIAAFINKPVDMNFLILGNYFLYYIAGISGSLFLYLVSKKIKSGNWLTFLGKNTLIIMCIHDPIKRIVVKIVSAVSHIPADTLRQSTWGSMICLIVLMLILVPAIHIINKYMPFLLGKKYTIVKEPKVSKVNV